MSKQPPTKAPPQIDASKYCKSTFTLTFAVEILGIEVFHDCNEGWLDLGPCVQGLKLQYQLYYGQSFDIDVLIWPHAAKIWCGSEYGWVRTWQFLEHRYLTFSIRHVFPVRVVDLRNFVVTVTPTLGVAALSSNAKNDKNYEVYLPPLSFGQRRYFALVLETLEEDLDKYIHNLLWKLVVDYIPASYLDGTFDVPYSVSDIRHQDAVLYHVQNSILNWKLPEEIEAVDEESEIPKNKASKLDAKISHKEKETDKKKADLSKTKGPKFEIALSGDTILAGAGRIVPFDDVGERPSDLGPIIVLMSSANLPAQDDLPILFINIDTLFDVPLAELKRLGITQVYTHWELCDEVHDSQYQDIKIRKTERNLKFNDHHAMPLDPDLATKVTATFLDNPYEIELRGIRHLKPHDNKAKFFGYDTTDRDFSTGPPPKPTVEEIDIPIAVTKIDACALAKGLNGFIRGDYPLYPPRVTVAQSEREGICTNDINAIGASVRPTLIVSPGVILEAQMTMEVSMGLVGCKPRRLTACFSRMFCLNKDSESMMAILGKVLAINEELAHGPSDNLLTGFAIDTGDIVIFYLEGPRDGSILKVWEMTEDFYNKVRPVFNSSSRYSSRIYPEFVYGARPFVVLKMYVPLGVVLACPPIYARPAMPLPTRSAALKLGRLISSEFRVTPSRNEMPTTDELKSFRLELCAPPRPPLVALPEIKADLVQKETNIPPQRPAADIMIQSAVNWEDR